MNRQYRLVWSKRLHMRVAVSETARAEGKSAAGESLVTTAGGAGASGRFARAPGWPRSLAAIGVAAALWMPTWAAALSMPSGALLDLNSSGGYSGGWASYSVGFTPTESGNNYILFAFRQDPAFWTFGQVSLLAPGSTTNLFTNANFATGGLLSADSGLQAPANWGVVYQAGTVPAAAGSWQPGFDGDASAGSWYDGAVGSFDGIYQGVDLSAGTRYTIGFRLYGDDPASAAAGIQMGVFAGPCLTLTGPVADCRPSNPGFVPLATPGDAANAGNPATDIDASEPYHLASEVPATVNPAFDGGTLRMDASPTQDFTISGNGGTIDQAGAASTLSGVLSDATGAGSLTIANSGTGGSVTLTGANTYTGATTIAAGATLALAGEGSIASSSGVVGNGTLDISGTNAGASLQTLSGTGSVNLGGQGLTLTDARGTFAGTIAGSGGVTIAGGSETLSGTNTYSGGTTVRNGATLSIVSDANLGASTGGVSLDGGTLRTAASFTTGRDITLGAGGGTIDTTADTTRVAGTGTFRGTGRLAKAGAGTLALGGTLAQAGGITVNVGTLVLSGNNTYTGGTTVAEGATLQVAADAHLGATTGNLLTLDGGTLQTTAGFSTARDIALGSQGGTVDTAAGTTLAAGGTITGTGGLTQSGNGTLVLAGSNTYSGGTTVAAGTLQVSADAHLGAASGGVRLDGGTLRTTASFATGRDITLGTGGGTLHTEAGATLAGGGTVEGSGTLAKEGAGTLSLAGTVSHTGGIVADGGTLVLSGSNSYSGGTRVNSGATLQVAADANLGSTGGNPLVLDGGTLHTTGSFASGRAIALGSAGGTLRMEAGTTLTQSSVLSGASGLDKTGTGTLSLAGANTYSGTTTIAEGTLALTGNGSIAASSGVVNEGTLDISATTAGASVRTLSGTGNVALGGQTLTLTDASGTFSGRIGGSGGVAVAGGTQTLSGANSYAGGSTVGGGATLRVGSDANLGAASGSLTLAGGTLQTTGSFSSTRDIAVAGSGSFDIAAGSTVSNASGRLTGNGALVKNGSGTLELGGSLSHTGGTVVNAGVLKLSGANSYTGGNTLNGGTLQVGADSNLGAAGSGLRFNGGALQATSSFSSDRALDVSSAGGTLSTDAGATLTLNGALSGSGAVTKEGSGTLVLAGDSAGADHRPGTGWTGGLRVNAGLVQVTNAWGLGWGDVVVHGGRVNTLVDIRTGQTIALAAGSSIDTAAGTVTTLSGDIVSAAGGSGCFVKSGQGTLNITGSAMFATGTCVQQGVLRANGIIAGNMTVAPGATLRGAGVIQGAVDVRGTLAPGNSPGYLSTTGTVTMAAGSTYQEDIAGTAQASAASPVGASGYYSYLRVGNNGRFAIDPATTLAPMLRNIFTPGEAGYNSPAYTPALGDTFRIVTAEGGISGRFGTLAQPDGLQGGTRFAAFYNVFGSNSIDLVVLPQSYAGWLAGSNGNTRSVARALDGIAAGSEVGAATTGQDQLLYVSAQKDAASLPGYAKGLAGEIHGALAAVAPRAGLAVTEAVGRQLTQATGAGKEDVKQGSALWIEAGGNRAHWSGDSAASGFAAERAQFTVGANVFQRGDARLGLGFSHANTGVQADLGSGKVRENIGFLYGQNALGSLLVDGIAAYGRITEESQRSNPTTLGAAGLASAAKGRSALVSAGVRAPWQLVNGTIAPFARMTVQKVARDATAETGDTPAALQLDRFSATGTRLVGGLSGESAAKDPLAATATWQYSAGLGVDAGALARPVVQARLAGVGTQVSAPEAGRVFLQFSVSGTARLDPQSYVYYGLSGDLRKGRSEVGVNAGLRVAF